MKKLLPLIGGAVGGLVGLGLLCVWLFSGGITADGKLDLATRLLDDGRWDVAGRIARELEDTVDQETNSAWHYVQGVSKLQSLGDELDSPKNRVLLADATEHLVKADEIGFPIGYRGKGRYYLGWCYFHTYQFDEVTKILDSPMELWPRKRSDAFRMNVEANLRKLPADYAEAEAQLEAWASIPGLTMSERARIQLARAQNEFEHQRYPQLEPFLMEIPEETAEHDEALLWRGRWRIEQATLMEPSDKRTALIDEAQQIIRKLMISAGTPKNLRRQSQFLAGRILRLQGKNQEALGSFSTVRHANPQSAEAITSSLEEAEILLEQGKLEDTVATCHLLLRNIEDLSLYNGYWLPVAELRTRLLQIGRSLAADREYQQVIRLATHIELAFPPSDSVRLKAEAYLQWGDDIQAAQMGLTRDQQIPLRRKAEEKYMAAAEQFELLARLELRSTEYPEILWRAINANQAANDLENANRLLKKYLVNEEKTKRPRGFLALAKNYMNAAQWDRAITPLSRCIHEYPNHAILYETRLLAAKAHLEMDQLEEAVKLLDENLFEYNLSPRSETWRDAMFTLGSTRFKQGKRALLEADALARDGAEVDSILPKYQESQERLFQALKRLGHASTRYVDSPRFYEARYMMAHANRLAARTYKELAEENDAIIESKRRQLLSQWRDLLNSTLDQYSTLRDEVSKNQELFESLDQYDALVRNCVFGEADTLFDLGDWESAAEAYRNAAGRYMNKPEALEALVQLAHCNRKLGKPDEAKKNLKQAEQVLSRVPPEMDAQFVSLTRTDRNGWKELLDWLKRWD
ncbi:MAG: hypothetical protein Aurels2KO_22030 [Aureliella sp.]